MTSWGPFCTSSMRYTRGGDFALILFEVLHKAQSCLPLFAIENQQNQLIALAKMADCN